MVIGAAILQDGGMRTPQAGIQIVSGCGLMVPAITLRQTDIWLLVSM